MTRIQKRRLGTAKHVISTFILLSCLLISFHYFTHSTLITQEEGNKRTCMILGFLIADILFISFVNRPKKVELTEEERQLPIAPVVNLSNKSVWRVFVIAILTALSAYISCAALFIPELWRYGTHWPILVGAFSPSFVMLALYRRNEYIIEGKTLIVREYKFTRLDTDLRIPIDTIDTVYIKNNYSLMPRVVLEIQGLKRELRCITHCDELAVEILLRNGESHPK